MAAVWLTGAGGADMGLFKLEDDVVIASAPRAEDAEGRFRGHVDLFRPGQRIDGWVVDLDAPDAPLTVQITVGTSVIASCEASRVRGDLQSVMGGEGRVGFRFAPDCLDGVRRLPVSVRGRALTLRVAGTNFVLPSAEDLPSAGKLQKDMAAARGAERQGEPGLEARLAALRAQAAVLCAKGPVALPEHPAGYIDSAAQDEAGRVWLIGWMARQDADEFASVMEGDQPGGLALAWFSRPDLDARALGFIGVLNTGWVPKADAPAEICLRDDASLRLSARGGLKLHTMADFFSYLEDYLPKAVAGHVAGLRRLAAGADMWAANARSPGFTGQMALETVLALPGFGVLVTGWVLNPLKQVAGFAARFGESVLRGDADGVTFVARPDLAKGYPALGYLAGQAGFAVVLRGALRAEDMQSAMFKIIYEDGMSSNHVVDMKLVSRLEKTDGLVRAGALYPALAAEPFFGDFVKALVNDARARMRPARMHRLEKADGAMVFVVPERRSDALYVLNAIEERLGGLAEPPGVVLIAGQSANRFEVMKFLLAVKKITRLRYSLFFAEDTNYVLNQLGDILLDVEAERFVFVAGSVVLSAQGWQDALELLALPVPPLTFLQVEDVVRPEAGGGASSECFVWVTDGFVPWAEEAPVYLDGFYGGNGLHDGFGGAEIRRAGATRLAPRRVSQLLDAANMVAGSGVI